MDWAKAKNILIIILIITNIMIWYMAHPPEYGDSNRSEESLSQYTISLLNENNIFLDIEELPDAPGKMPSLTVTYDTFDSNIIQDKINSGSYGQIREMSENNVREYCNRILNREKISSSKIECTRIIVDGDNAEAIYKNTYKDIPVEKCEMKFTFRDRKLTDFQRQWINVEAESDTRQKTLSPITALLTFMNIADTSNAIHVQEINIVYLLDAYQINDEQPISDTAFPAWQIIYNDDEITYISAFEQ